MRNLLISGFLFQGLAMFIDEFYFHRKRGLPIWEKLGHPLDSLSVLACYLYLLFFNYSEEHLWIYIGLCVFSSLLITKDEFVHTQRCEARENWLHALLFVIHPVTLFSAGIIWYQAVDNYIIRIQTLLILTFAVYQIIYWGLYDKRRS